MTLKTYLATMGVSVILCWSAWFLVIFNIDPENAGFIGLAAFYFSFLLALTGVFFFISFMIRRLFNKKAIVARQVGTSFRQAISYALIVLGALFLQSRGLLNWLNIILLVLTLTVLEIFFVAAGHKRTAGY